MMKMMRIVTAAAFAAALFSAGVALADGMATGNPNPVNNHQQKTVAMNQMQQMRESRTDNAIAQLQARFPRKHGTMNRLQQDHHPYVGPFSISSETPTEKTIAREQAEFPRKHGTMNRLQQGDVTHGLGV